MGKREEYIDRFADQLKEWGTKIDVLKSRADKAAASMTVELNKQMEMLNKKREEAGEKLQQLKESSAGAWENIRTGAEKTWKELMESVSEGIEKFPRLGTEMLIPFVDMWEDEKNIYVEAELPGLRPKDIKARIQKGSLVISGRSSKKKETKKKNCRRLERYQGLYYRQIGLSGGINVSKIKAKYAGGVLSITLPKKEKARPSSKQIKIT